ncbi:MAG: phosphoribosyl-ATP diphosphatase [Pseudomonadota bacterium]
MTDDALGPALAALWRTIEARKGAAPDASYTASLLAAGPARCAKKFGEEAVEAALAAALGDRDDLAAEAADVLYHLLVMLAAAGVSPDEVAAALNARTGVSGHDEKASRRN